LNVKILNNYLYGIKLLNGKKREDQTETSAQPRGR